MESTQHLAIAAAPGTTLVARTIRNFARVSHKQTNIRTLYG